jgi:D-alanine--poly(phosphoribitol) ligase subunit 1
MSSRAYTYNLGQYFSDVAEQQKAHVAIRHTDGNTFAFGDLNALSNQLAYVLIDKKIGRNDVVAILNNKTNTSYALMLACLKIGAIYTNLDPKSPEERFVKMLEICQPKLICFFEDQKLITAEISHLYATVNYESEAFLQDVSNHSTEFPKVNHFVNSNDPAYIMFTSGSTGFPKGVVISHGNILNFIHWAKEVYSVTQNDVFTNINPMHFDNSVFDFYASLFNGAALVPIGDHLTRNPKRMIEALNKVSPTIWFSVPSMLVFVLNMRALTLEDLPTLRVVTFGGEGFPKNQLRKLWNYWGNRVQFVNVYGPTECTCICSSYLVSEKDMLNDELLPLGPVAPNFYALVLDENGNQVENNVVGELCIGGPNVGIGYYYNPEKTESVFVSDPTRKDYDRTIYKSGDLVKQDASGMLFFAGRKDNQIKKMGYRIELEEIENALNSLDTVFESAVVYINNEKYRSKIIAFVKSDVPEKELKENLKKKLPLYMIPDNYNYVDVLPKNQNGKINRIALRKELEE